MDSASNTLRKRAYQHVRFLRRLFGLDPGWTIRIEVTPSEELDADHPPTGALADVSTYRKRRLSIIRIPTKWIDRVQINNSTFREIMIHEFTHIWIDANNFKMNITMEEHICSHMEEILDKAIRSRREPLR